MKKITCFIPEACVSSSKDLLKEMFQTGLIENIFILTKTNEPKPNSDAEYLKVENLSSTETVFALTDLCRTPYMMLITTPVEMHPGQFFIERFLSIAEDTGAGMLYSDFWYLKNGFQLPHPLVDYQTGSIRDDFDFGHVLFFNTEIIKAALNKVSEKYDFAGLYSLRLKISQDHTIMRIPEFLYSVIQEDTRQTGKRIFDYVNPKNRDVQIEMEKAATIHLKDIGAFLAPVFKEVNFFDSEWPVEASVIIPVKNREKTISDALESVLNQKTSFSFNLIVVDNHSTDKTSEILKEYSMKYRQLIHIVPERNDLGIGGCWNLAVHDPRCGKFAVQLDSDDLYSDENTLEKIVSAFYQEKCAMVIGSYKMTNFRLEEIPPGIIDHKEWTPDNGRNNALRINGLGAPRAFYTPVLRKLKIPNVSYGEDYQVGLALSRKYRIGRIYAPVYLCRRWEDNTDAALDVMAMNRHNYYKDRLRSIEIAARIQLNKEKQQV